MINFSIKIQQPDRAPVVYTSSFTHSCDAVIDAINRYPHAQSISVKALDD